MWNKVKIDGTWYNVDLTADGDKILRYGESDLKYCLRSDNEFEKNHKQEKGRKIECDIDYPREEVEKAFKFAEEFMRQSIDAEYEQIEEKPNFFDRLKAKAMTLFGKRKMLGVPQTPSEVKATEERRYAWLEKGGIVLHNGAELSKVNVVQQRVQEPGKKDREPGDDE